MILGSDLQEIQAKSGEVNINPPNVSTQRKNKQAITANKLCTHKHSVNIKCNVWITS